MRFTLRSALICVLVSGAIGLSYGQGSYDKTAFENTMGDTIKSTRLVLNSLIAEDWAKAQSAAEALSASAKQIRKLTPKVAVDRIGDFQAHADSLGAQSARIAIAAKAHNRAQATLGFGQMVETCMGCHTTFRK